MKCNNIYGNLPWEVSFQLTLKQCSIVKITALTDKQRRRCDSDGSNSWCNSIRAVLDYDIALSGESQEKT